MRHNAFLCYRPLFLLKAKVSQRLLMERGIETCLIHFLHQLLSKWIIVVNSGFNKIGLLASYLMHLFSCCMKCLARNIIYHRCTLIWLLRSLDLSSPDVLWLFKGKNILITPKPWKIYSKNPSQLKSLEFCYERCRQKREQL